MRSWVWDQNGYKSCDSIPVSDRGFRYGMSVFESMRVHGGRPLFWSEHLARLRQACIHRGFPAPDEVLAQAESVLRACGEEAFARVYVTAGDGTVATSYDHCRVYVIAEERDRPDVDAYDLAMPHEMHQPIFGGIKTANYWPNVDVLQRALQRTRHEALLFNEHAELVSACMANVFVVRGEKISTPALNCGARDGVIREWVMKRAEVRECSIFIEAIQEADEIFITNSWIGIMPVASVDGRPVKGRAIGAELKAALEKEFAAQLA